MPVESPRHPSEPEFRGRKLSDMVGRIRPQLPAAETADRWFTDLLLSVEQPGLYSCEAVAARAARPYQWRR
jgi:hypothetical protein